jgi:hypothetical protein
MVPSFNQVNLIYDGTIVAFTWPTDDGQPRFIDCPPLAETLARKYPEFYIAPRQDLMDALSDEYLQDLLPSDRKLLASNQFKTVGEVIFHVFPSE